MITILTPGMQVIQTGFPTGKSESFFILRREYNLAMKNKSPDSLCNSCPKFCNNHPIKWFDISSLFV